MPSKVEPGVVKTLNGGINAVLADAAVKARMQTMGLDIMTNDPAATGKFFQSEIAFWSKRVKALSLSMK